LSAETATGQYPLETVKTMSRVIAAAEKDCGPRPKVGEAYLVREAVPLAVAEAVSRADSQSAAIFAFTSSGFTAELISNQFPEQVIIALTNDKTVLTRMTIYRAVYSVFIRQPRSFDDTLKLVEKIGKQFKLADKGATVVITGGVPFGRKVPTNFMMYHTIKGK
jgi:pyruvate kinase